MTMNRRTVVRGMAWSVPAVSVAAAAPAFAASRFACTGAMFCKTQNRQDSSKWDFEFAPLSCSGGIVASVLVNGKPATYVQATSKRGAYWVLRRQPHSYFWAVEVRDTLGVVGFSKTVDTRTSACPV